MSSKSIKRDAMNWHSILQRSFHLWRTSPENDKNRNESQSRGITISQTETYTLQVCTLYRAKIMRHLRAQTRDAGACRPSGGGSSTFGIRARPRVRGGVDCGNLPTIRLIVLLTAARADHADLLKMSQGYGGLISCCKWDGDIRLGEWGLITISVICWKQDSIRRRTLSFARIET